MKTKATLAAVAASLAPIAAFAAIGTVCDIFNLLQRVSTTFGAVVSILAILIILYAAFLFLTAGGNEEKVASAKNALIWGLVGIAVGLFSANAVNFINQIIGGSFGGTGCSI